MSSLRRTSAPPLRALALWLLTLAAVAAVPGIAGPSVGAVLRAPAAARFDQLLVACCAVAAAVGAIALLATTTSVLVALCTGRSLHRVGALRRLVLVACGVAVVATAAPATARSPIAGLPLPDRVGGGVRPEHPSATVRTGDSLWSIATARLGARASDAEVATYVQRLHVRNQAVIGPDPDLIRPGQHLQLPPTRPLDR